MKDVLAIASFALVVAALTWGLIDSGVGLTFVMMAL